MLASVLTQVLALVATSLMKIIKKRKHELLCGGQRMKEDNKAVISILNTHKLFVADL